MKKLFVGSGLGATGLAWRSWGNLKSIPFGNPERAAAVANAILSERLITQLPQARSSFLDIGAHIGSVFSAVHHNEPTVTLRAIEADPSKAAELTSKFPHCEIFNCAVGETPGTATFHIHAKAGYNSLVEQKGSRSVGSVDVEVRTLDELLADAEVHVIKLDIEGAELGALIGGRELVQRNRPLIMFESVSLEENSLGYSPEMLWRWFDAEGYQVFTPDRVAHTAPPLTLDVFLDAHAHPKRTHNYFAIAEENRTDIRDRARSILNVPVPPGAA